LEVSEIDPEVKVSGLTEDVGAWAKERKGKNRKNRNLISLFFKIENAAFGRHSR
jgi:hypothetical protein